MMNIPPGEANKLSMFEYEAILWNWNDSHSTEDELPDAEVTMALIDKINADPRLTGARPS